MITTVEIPIEQQKQYTLNRIGETIIYLGIPTNIICIDNRREPEHIIIADNTINDFTATLYLGKITFKKNKYGNLAPIYIPSQITKSSFEGLNTFWLNEINPNAKKPFLPIIQCEQGGDFRICKGNKENIPHQKIYYYRTKKNITLNKEQIISYFTELHRLNSTFIKKYIDSINTNDGIRANFLHNKIYDDLLQKGLLQKDMFRWFSDGTRAASSRARLITLDYLKKTSQYNFMIAFFNERFYPYFIVSLKKFILEYYDKDTNEYSDTNNLIFNTGAYKNYYSASLFDKQLTKSYFYKDSKQRYAINLFMQNASSIWAYIAGFEFQSPNRIYTISHKTGNIIDDDKPPIYAPSPLGNYYFELIDNKNTFVEYYQRIYPSITNPPKGWTKEMMSKLELKLE